MDEAIIGVSASSLKCSLTSRSSAAWAFCGPHDYSEPNAAAAPPSEAVSVEERYKHPSNGACRFAARLTKHGEFRNYTNCHTKSLCSIEETFDYSLVIVWELLVGAVGLEPTTR